MEIWPTNQEVPGLNPGGVTKIYNEKVLLYFDKILMFQDLLSNEVFGVIKYKTWNLTEKHSKPF